MPPRTLWTTTLCAAGRRGAPLVASAPKSNLIGEQTDGKYAQQRTLNIAGHYSKFYYSGKVADLVRSSISK